MSSLAQYEREKRLEMRERREKELAMLTLSRQTADQRYVRDFLAWVWPNLVSRKLQQADQMPLAEQRRLKQLRELGAA